MILAKTKKAGLKNPTSPHISYLQNRSLKFVGDSSTQGASFEVGCLDGPIHLVPTPTANIGQRHHWTRSPAEKLSTKVMAQLDVGESD